MSIYFAALAASSYKPVLHCWVSRGGTLPKELYKRYYIMCCRELHRSPAFQTSYKQPGMTHGRRRLMLPQYHSSIGSRVLGDLVALLALVSVH